MDKHWFVVRDGSVKTERLLTLVPKNPKSVIECTPDTRRTILDLFLTLQHPYIYPVLDVEFVEGATDSETTFITLVLPFNSKGSLKDLIYKVWYYYFQPDLLIFSILFIYIRVQNYAHGK